MNRTSLATLALIALSVALMGSFGCPREFMIGYLVGAGLFLTNAALLVFIGRNVLGGGTEVEEGSAPVGAPRGGKGKRRIPASLIFALFVKVMLLAGVTYFALVICRVSPGPFVVGTGAALAAITAPLYFARHRLRLRAAS